MSGKPKRNLREELREYEWLTGRLSFLLTATANALKGSPPKNMLHDWSDLPFLVKTLHRRAEHCTCGAMDPTVSMAQLKRRR